MGVPPVKDRGVVDNEENGGPLLRCQLPILYSIKLAHFVICSGSQTNKLPEK
jgi:hypothetical protein